MRKVAIICIYEGNGLIAFDTLVLILICLFDLLTTLFFISLDIAIEANPIMAYALSQGVHYFIWVKVCSFLPFSVLIEIYRRQEPFKAKVITRIVWVIYLGMYLYGTLTLNFS